MTNTAPLLNRHQRRAQYAMTSHSIEARKRAANYYTKVNGISHETLTIPSYTLLERLLIQYGNTLSAEHKAALIALVGLMTKMAQGTLKGRWAFGLPTGMGKTSAIISWVASLHSLGAERAALADLISVAVSASKVEALCQLKRDLIDQGVPEEAIGLLHSYKCDPERVGQDGYASMPATPDNADRQIMLVTHARVRSPSGMARFNSYQGKPRSLLIYDESLLVSDSVGISYREIKGALGYIEGRHEGVEKYQPVIAYLSKCVSVIEAELTRQKEQPGTPCGTIRLPAIDEQGIASLRSALGNYSLLEPARQLLDLTTHDLRVVDSGQGGVVHYNIAVPAELRNILILDASYPVRRLMHLDPTVKDAETLQEVRNIGTPLAKLKDFSNVTLHQMPIGGGRDTMSRDFNKPEEDRKIAKEVVSVVQGIPHDQACLVFVFKDRPGEKTFFREKLTRSLNRAGIDTEVKIDGKPRINIATWGMETSLNCYAHCQHVILAGVLQRSPVDIAAAFLGQTDNLTGTVSKDDVRTIALSEVCHVIYQALSRGASRVLDNGKAKTMQGYIIHKDTAIQPELTKVMPGAVWKVWGSKHGADNQGIIAKTAMRVAEYLEKLPHEIKVVSSRKVKEALGLNTVSKMTVTKAMRLVPSLTPWLIQGRSLERAFG